MTKPSWNELQDKFPGSDEHEAARFLTRKLLGYRIRQPRRGERCHECADASPVAGFVLGKSGALFCAPCIYWSRRNKLDRGLSARGVSSQGRPLPWNSGPSTPEGRQAAGLTRP